MTKQKMKERLEEVEKINIVLMEENKRLRDIVNSKIFRQET